MRAVKTLLLFAIIGSIAILYVRGETGIIEKSYRVAAIRQRLDQLSLSFQSVSFEVARQASSAGLEKKLGMAKQTGKQRWEVAKTLYPAPAKTGEGVQLTMRTSRER